jgi:lipid A disaccharide synthetase
MLGIVKQNVKKTKPKIKFVEFAGDPEWIILGSRTQKIINTYDRILIFWKSVILAIFSS